MRLTRLEPTPIEGEEGYCERKEEAERALHAGRLLAAEALFEEAFAATRHPRLQRLRDRAYCNWVGVGITCGKHDCEADLAKVLGSSSDLKARQLAAQHLGHLYWCRRQARASRMYSGMAHRLALARGDRHSEGVSLNSLGLSWLAESRWQEARRCFEEATEVLGSAPGEPGLQLLHSSVIYALSLGGSRREAMRLFHEVAWEVDLASCAPLYAPEMATSLAFSCLELEEPEAAIFWGEAALAGFAADAPRKEEPSADPVDRYAHYAVGEAAARLGEMEQARWHFTELQRKYYPSFAELVDLLLAVRTHGFVNWLA